MALIGFSPARQLRQRLPAPALALTFPASAPLSLRPRRRLPGAAVEREGASEPNPNLVTPSPAETPMEWLTGEAATTARTGSVAVLELGGRPRYDALFDTLPYTCFPVDALPASPTLPSTIQSGSADRSRRRYGVVLCLDAMGAVDDARGLMADLAEVTIDDGTLFLTTPLTLDRPPRHQSQIERGPIGLNYLLEASGFSLQALRPLGSADHAVIARRRPSRR